MNSFKNYSAPLCEVRKSGLRASILAGSQIIKAHDLEFSARQRGDVSAPASETKEGVSALGF